MKKFFYYFLALIFVLNPGLFPSKVYAGGKITEVHIYSDSPVPVYRHRTLSDGSVVGRDKGNRILGEYYEYSGEAPVVLKLTGTSHLFMAGDNHVLDPIFRVRVDGDTQYWRVNRGRPWLFYSGVFLAGPGVVMSIITIFTGPILVPNYYWWCAAGTGTVAGWFARGSAERISEDKYRSFFDENVGVTSFSAKSIELGYRIPF